MQSNMAKVKGFGYLEILMIYLLLNPVLDLLTSVMKELWGIELSIGILARGSFVLFTVVYMVFKNKYNPKLKKITLVYIGLVAVYLTFFIFNMYTYKGMAATIGEIKSIIKTFYFPILVVCILNCVYEEKEKIDMKWLAVNGLFYSAVMLLAQITGTQFSSYAFDKVGHTGWFYASNESGALMAILFPIVVWFIIENKKIFSAAKFLVLAFYIYSMYQIGTKVPAIAAVGTMGLVTLCFLIKSVVCKNKKERIKKFVIGGLLTAFSICLIFVSPVGENLDIHSQWFDENLSGVVESYGHKQPSAENSGEKENEKEITIEISESQARVLSFIFSSRDRYVLAKIQESMEAPMALKVLGLGFQEKVSDGSYSNEIVEIDYFDILFAYGLIGALLYWVFVFGVLFYGLYLLIKYMKLNLNNPMWYGIVSILMSLGVGFFAGHVFIAPAVSIYPAVIIIFSLYTVNTEEKGLKFKA